MKIFGLIGYPLSHSFSPDYFKSKWMRENQQDCDYHLFPLQELSQILNLIQQEPQLCGLNVTIPYKTKILPYINELEEAAQAIQAVNTIVIKNQKMKGYNTDYIGFKKMLLPYLKDKTSYKALILGNGGASKAVQFALQSLAIPYQVVSRQPLKHQISYQKLEETHFIQFNLIIHTTPLGMHPNEISFPPLPYHYIQQYHLVIDLIYNPEKSIFLQKAEQQNATIVNGKKMLAFQADASWEIWKSNFLLK